MQAYLSSEVVIPYSRMQKYVSFSDMSWIVTPKKIKYLFMKSVTWSEPIKSCASGWIQESFYIHTFTIGSKIITLYLNLNS